MQPHGLEGLWIFFLMAALCLFAGAVIIFFLSKRGGSALLQSALRWCFSSSLVFFLLYIATLIAIKVIDQEIRVAGIVVDGESQSVIPNAFVYLNNAGSGVTDNQGEFSFTVPAARAQDHYSGRVTANGYRNKQFELAGPVPVKAIELTMTRDDVEASNLIRKPREVHVSHYLGMPLLDMILTFNNPTDAEIEVNKINVKMIDPEGIAYDMAMLGTYVPPAYSSLNPVPLTAATVPPFGVWELAYRFGRVNYSYQQLLWDAQIEYGNRTQIPAVGQVIFSAELAEKLKNFMMDNIIWRGGEWQLVVQLEQNNERIESSFKFTLKERDVERFYSVSNHYRTAYSVLPNLERAPDGSSILRVELSQ